MPDSKPVMYNGSIELTTISNEEILSNINDLIKNGTAIFRLNAENKLVTVPADRIERFIGESRSTGVEFYIEKNWKNKSPRADESSIIEKAKPKRMPGVIEALEKFSNSKEMIKNFQVVSIEERESILDKSLESLHELRSRNTSFEIESIVKMVDVIANTFYANYANLEDNLSSENVKNNIHGIFVKTEWIIRVIIELFKSNGTMYKSMNNIDRISTGSYTIDNMNKGLLWFIGFCFFYNDYVEQGLVTKKIRGDFKDKYSRYYKKRMNAGMDSIEKIIKGGLRKIDIDKDLPLYGVGALLYDIGKIPFISYHDGEDEYDEEMVKIHVLLGYNMILKTKKYRFTVAAMAAFHHEYYGGKGSYNFTNPILSKLNNKKRTEDNAGYFISYDEKEFRDGLALSFFPCKIIEIIDVHNALIHHRKNTHFEALKILKKNFITLDLKIDPLIFDIFLEFKQKCGLITQEERNEIDAIIY